MPEYYKIPFSFEKLLRREDQDLKCSLETSIQQNITLVITSKFNSFRFDPEYGCQIWEVDFMVPSNLNSWKEEIKASLHKAILENEKRIEEIFEFTVEVKYVNPSGFSRINQTLKINLKASIKGTNQTIQYTEVLYFSPYSLV